MTSKIKTKRERVKFASDNVAGACPEVLDAIIKANEGDSTPYVMLKVDILNKLCLSILLLINPHSIT